MIRLASVLGEQGGTGPLMEEVVAWRETDGSGEEAGRGFKCSRAAWKQEGEAHCVWEIGRGTGGRDMNGAQGRQSARIPCSRKPLLRVSEHLTLGLQLILLHAVLFPATPSHTQPCV